MIKIYVDADGCPVKDEIFKVAERYKIQVILVANKWMKLPANSLFEMKVVEGKFDAADDWIVETASPSDIVVTTDILLAERIVKNGILCLGTKGDEFTEDNIGSMVSMRELNQNLRHMGENRGGPAPMDNKARSKFLGKLDQLIQRLKQKG